MSCLLLHNLQQSWADKMVERVRNVIKRDSKKTKQEISALPEPKRRAKAIELLRRYPVVDASLNSEREDEDTMERHKKAISSELMKAKPRDAVLLPLMKSTYGDRWIFVMNEATLVAAILARHPALARPAVVSIIVHRIVYRQTIIIYNFD